MFSREAGCCDLPELETSLADLQSLVSQKNNVSKANLNSDESEFWVGCGRVSGKVWWVSATSVTRLVHSDSPG